MSYDTYVFAESGNTVPGSDCQASLDKMLL